MVISPEEKFPHSLRFGGVASRAEAKLEKIVGAPLGKPGSAERCTAGFLDSVNVAVDIIVLFVLSRPVCQPVRDGAPREKSRFL